MAGNLMGVYSSPFPFNGDNFAANAQQAVQNRSATPPHRITKNTEPLQATTVPDFSGLNGKMPKPPLWKRLLAKRLTKNQAIGAGIGAIITPSTAYATTKIVVIDQFISTLLKHFGL